MTFDKSKVYTSLNAEELEVGSEVIVAYDLNSLKYQVEANSWPTYVKKLDEVLGPDHIHRFKLPDGRAYNLAYLVSKPSEAKHEEDGKWIAYLSSAGYLTACKEDAWEMAQEDCGAKAKLFVGTESEVKEWYKARQKFAPVIKAWEDGKTIQFYSTTRVDWRDVVDNEPFWEVNVKYRVKPAKLKWTDLEIGDVLRSGTERRQVNGIDTSDEPDEDGDICHICLAGWWCTDKELETWELEK